MMNELEVVYWSVANNLVHISTVDQDFTLDYLMITALFAKKLTCGDEEVKIHESYLSHNFQMFMKNYIIWENMKSIKEEDFDFVKVNNEFKQLFSDEFGPNQHEADLQEDYNFIVDCLEDEHIKREVHTTKNLEDPKIE